MVQISAKNLQTPKAWDQSSIQQIASGRQILRQKPGWDPKHKDRKEAWHKDGS